LGSIVEFASVHVHYRRNHMATIMTKFRHESRHYVPGKEIFCENLSSKKFVEKATSPDNKATIFKNKA
jgi:hypothetical protein